MYTKLICAFLLSTALFACNVNDSEKESKDLASASPDPHPSTYDKPGDPIPVQTQQLLTDSISQPVQSNSTTAKAAVALPSADWSRKIVKSATLKVEVKNFRNYNQQLYEKVKLYGGYIAQEEASLTADKSETAVTIKVPVLQFDGLVNDLTNTEEKVLQKNIQSADVTGDIADTRARLEAKKQVRLKYLELMKESKNMSEVLQVQNEVNSIQEEIEAASGRYASLSNQSAYSTLSLTFFQLTGNVNSDVKDPGFFSRTTAAFSTGAGWLANLFVGLLSIWPLLLLIAGAWLIYKKRNNIPVQQKG